MGIPVRARVGPPLGCVPLQLFGYFLRGTRQSHFVRAPRIRPSPVQKEGIERVEDPGPEPRNLGQDNFFGRKIFRRLTSPLAATLPAEAVFESEER